MNKTILFLLACLIVGVSLMLLRNSSDNLPLIAIANYGPHASLITSINALKEHLAMQGFIEGKSCRYMTSDVGFDPSLIGQMITQLLSENPTIFVALTTPVAQQAKTRVTNIPLVYMNITDPLQAGLLTSMNVAHVNSTVSSDRQDMSALLVFARLLLPNAHRVGVLYATAEANDTALIAMINKSAQELGMSVVAVGIDHQRDIAVRMQAFKNNIDFLYVGTSGPIQPALPIIATQARSMNIPLFNAESQAVKDGLALASFGVDYACVGKNAAIIVAQLLEGKRNIAPRYPSIDDYHKVINIALAHHFNITIPHDVKQVGS